MNKYWRIGLLLALYPLYGCYPGYSFPWGYCLRTVQPDGRPVQGAREAMVLLPEGGTEELERRVRAREPLEGWMATTDKRGKAEMSKDAEPASAGALQPVRYVFSERSRGYERDPMSAGATSFDLPALDLGDSVGLVVLANGYEPYIGTARLGRRGLMPKLQMTTLAGREPSQKRESATITLDPNRKLIAGGSPANASKDEVEGPE